MSFQVPRNVPAFTSAQRPYEDGYWRAAQRAGGAGGEPKQNGNTNIGSKVSEFFESGSSRKDLPMYKDKPYASSRRRRPAWKQKRTWILGVLVLLAFWWLTLGGIGAREAVVAKKGHDVWGWLQKEDTDQIDWSERRERVKDAFVLSWDGYEKYAWGMDEYYPLSKKGRNMVEGGMGWIIVDALDTMMLMNLTTRVSQAREWIATSLHYNQDHEVNTFETTIRMMGGLLSAHYLSTNFPDLAPQTDDDRFAPGEDLYIEKATDLADRLLGAFDSNSGVPYASVNLNTSSGIPSHADGGASSTAEAATLQLEFKYLAKLTGEPNYWERAEKVIEVIDNNGMEDGLLPIYIYANTGEFRGNNIRLGSRGDSYYEYLIKQYLQTSHAEQLYLDMWNEAMSGIRKHLITFSKHASLTVLGERPSGLDGPLSPKMDHLVCFMPGTIALAATGGQTVHVAKKHHTWGREQDEDMALAKELMKTCWGMYLSTATGLAPEIAHFEIDDPPRQPAHIHHELGLGGAGQIISSKPLSNDPDAPWRKDYIIKPADQHNLQRPETVESLFYMYRITQDPIYREWGWQMFKSFIEHTTAPDSAGFTSLQNANAIPPQTKDNMESFWLAETLKYFYLLFSDEEFMPLDKIVINTEAHLFPRFEMGSMFKTGWERKPRGKDGKIISENKEEKPLGDQQPAVPKDGSAFSTRIVKVEKVDGKG